MPTNFVRHDGGKPQARKVAPVAAAKDRVVTISAGRFSVRATLLATPTADRVWAALPLHGIAETWGAAIHFATPIETGRDRTAKINGVKGEICFWSDDDRIIIAFGPTPISRPNEIRLPRPCNVFAAALDDVAVFAGVQPGQKISIVPAPLAAKKD